MPTVVNHDQESDRGLNEAVRHGRRRARRKWQRTPLYAEVELHAPFAAAGIAFNISAGGVLLVLPLALSVGEICVLSIEGQPEMGRVVRCSPAGVGWLVGLEFVGDPDEAVGFAA